MRLRVTRAVFKRKIGAVSADEAGGKSEVGQAMKEICVERDVSESVRGVEFLGHDAVPGMGCRMKEVAHGFRQHFIGVS